MRWPGMGASCGRASEFAVGLPPFCCGDWFALLDPALAAGLRKRLAMHHTFCITSLLLIHVHPASCRPPWVVVDLWVVVDPKSTWRTAPSRSQQSPERSMICLISSRYRRLEQATVVCALAAFRP